MHQPKMRTNDPNSNVRRATSEHITSQGQYVSEFSEKHKLDQIAFQNIAEDSNTYSSTRIAQNGQRPFVLLRRCLRWRSVDIKASGHSHNMVHRHQVRVPSGWQGLTFGNHESRNQGRLWTPFFPVPPGRSFFLVRQAGHVLSADIYSHPNWMIGLSVEASPN